MELYDAVAHENTKRMNGVVQAVSQYMNRAAGVFFIYLVTLLFIYPHFIKGEFTLWEIISLLLIIGVGNIISYICGYAYNLLLISSNQDYYYTALRIFLTVVNVILSIWLIKSGRSIQTVKLVSASIFALGPICLFLFVPRLYQLDRKAPPDHSWRKNQKYAAVNSIALIIHENTDVVLLTILTSTKTVSVYSVYYLVIKGLKGVLSIFTSSMEPFFGVLWAKKQTDRMSKTLKHYEFLIGAVVSISLSGALTLILPFISLYTRGITDTEYVLPVFALMTVLAELARCIRIPYLTVVQAAGKYKETQRAAIVEVVLNITTSIILTIRIGIVGVVVGTLIANLYRTLAYSRFVSRHLLPRSIRSTFLLIFFCLFNMTVNTLLFGAFTSMIGLEITTWSAWIMGAFIIVILSMIEVVVMSAIFYRNDLKWMLGNIRNFISKKYARNT